MSNREYTEAEFMLWPEIPIDEIDEFIDGLKPETHQDIINHLREKRHEAVHAAEQGNYPLALAHGETLLVLCHYYGKTQTLERLARKGHAFVGRKPGSKAAATLYIERHFGTSTMTAREIAETIISLSKTDPESPYEFEDDNSVYEKGKDGLITTEKLTEKVEYVRKQTRKR